MPKHGQASITVAKEVAEILNELYGRNKKELRKQGIFSKQQFILFAVRKYVEDLEKGGKRGSEGNL